MRITHAKVSGELNTAPEKIGGEDWDDPHTVAGIGVAFAGQLTLSDVASVETLEAWLAGVAIDSVFEDPNESSRYVIKLASPKYTSAELKSYVTDRAEMSPWGNPTGYKDVIATAYFVGAATSGDWASGAWEDFVGVDNSAVHYVVIELYTESAGVIVPRDMVVGEQVRFTIFGLFE